MSKTRQSPIEIKEKMRKNYKNKVQNCRGMLLDKFRESFNEQDLCTTLTDLYKSVIIYSEETDDIEERCLEQFKNEIIQEELEWWVKEYETSQMENFDWASIEEDSVVCPICKKNNFKIENNIVSCPSCYITIRSAMPSSEIRRSILDSVHKHSVLCSENLQFSIIPEGNENHIYAICISCNEMKAII